MSWPPDAPYGASRVGLGLAALGRPAYITTGRAVQLGTDRSVEAMRARTHAVLDAAYDAGVRYSTRPARTGSPRAFSPAG